MDGSGSVSDLKYDMCNPNHGGGGGGDPYIKRWNRKHFSFHGECDLVMLHSDEFHKFTGLDLHVRTTVQDWYSYIEMAALRVGDYVMEVHSQYLTLDGIEYTDHDLPLSFGGDFKYVINAPEVEEETKFHGAKVYRVDLHDESWINFKVYKEFVFIELRSVVEQKRVVTRAIQRGGTPRSSPACGLPPACSNGKPTVDCQCRTAPSRCGCWRTERLTRMVKGWSRKGQRRPVAPGIARLGLGGVYKSVAHIRGRHLR
jgi:hypothetical protein